MIYAGFYTENKNSDAKRTVHLHHYIEREKLRKYLLDELQYNNFLYIISIIIFTVVHMLYNFFTINIHHEPSKKDI